MVLRGNQEVDASQRPSSWCQLDSLGEDDRTQKASLELTRGCSVYTVRTGERALHQPHDVAPTLGRVAGDDRECLAEEQHLELDVKMLAHTQDAVAE